MTINVIHFLNVLANFITHLIHIIWNILKLLIFLDFRVVIERTNFEIHPKYNIKSQNNLLQIAQLKAGNNCKYY